MPLDNEPVEIVASEDFELRARARAGQASETFQVLARGARPLGEKGETRGIAKRELYDVRVELQRQMLEASENAKQRLIQIRQELTNKLETNPELPLEEREKTQRQINFINNKARDDWEDFSPGGINFTLSEYAEEEVLTSYQNLHAALKGQEVTLATVQPLISKPLTNQATMELDVQEEDLRLLTRAVASSSIDQLIGTQCLSQEKFGLTEEGRPVGISVEVDGVGVMGNLSNGKTYFLDVDYSSHAIQKGLYDLETLDYITGQIDRHAGNIFIDPETGTVRGIDNDLAFPEMGRDEMLQMEGAPSFPVRNLPRYMHADTAKKIESLRPDDLRESLSAVGYPPDGTKGKLTPKEIDGAVQRLQELQKHIQTLRQEGRVVSEFNKETFEEAVKHQEETSVSELARLGSHEQDEVTIDSVSAGELTSTSKTSYVGTVAVEKRVNAQNITQTTGEKHDFPSLKVALGTTGKAVRNPANQRFAELVEERRQQQRVELEAFHTPERNRLTGRLKVVEQQLQELEDPGLGTSLGSVLKGGPNSARVGLQAERLEILQEIRDLENTINERVELMLEEEKAHLWGEAEESLIEPEQQRARRSVGPQDPHYGSFEPFVGKEVVSAGGATGSGRVKVDGQNYQLKSSVAHADFKRRLKASGLNHENYGEVIASNISKAVVGEAGRRYIPEVQLRQDADSHEPKVTSKYLEGGRGDLDDLYRAEIQEVIPEHGLLPKDRNGKIPIIDATGRAMKHARITLDPRDQTRPGVLKLEGQAAQDVRRNIALSALMGDHDVNPGNMIAVEGGRVGRIDFGHAFNELVTGMGGKMTGGGGVQFQQNRILDFFNREKVSGAKLGGDPSKLWRDYGGIEPTNEMTQALREVASNNEALDGLVQAKLQFADLVVDLQTEDTPEARKELEDLTKSLTRISKNIGKPVTASDPGDVVREVFQNLDSFVREGQEQMKEVADLCSLQSRIDTFLRDPANEGRELPQEIQSIYKLLESSPDSTVKAAQGEGLQWMKTTKGARAFSGDLDSYVQSRRQVLRLELAEGAGLNEIERLQQRKEKLENNTSVKDEVSAFFKHGVKGVQGEIAAINERIEQLQAAVNESRAGITVEEDRMLVATLREGAERLDRQIHEIRTDAQKKIADYIHKIGPRPSEEELQQTQQRINELEGAHKDLMAKIKKEEKVISVREKLGIGARTISPLQVEQQQDVGEQQPPLQPRVQDLDEVQGPGRREEAPSQGRERSQSVREMAGLGKKTTEAPKRKMTL